MMVEVQFDGLVGPTHNYAGLSPGNVASESHAGAVSNPKEAARQALAKVRFVHGLGVAQGVLPPHDRPSLSTLRRLGFRGSDEAVLAAAARGDGRWLRACASASAMWVANAATVAPSSDTADGRVHLTPANLQQMFHRSIEPPTTARILRAIFADPSRFAVHDPLPGAGHLADEGAANHSRLSATRGVVHLFAWGRSSWSGAPPASIRPARQTLEASEAVARLHGLDLARCLFARQHPAGIDAGAFHTDVLAVAGDGILMLHELAFVNPDRVLAECRALLGDDWFVVRAAEAELPVARAVAAYPFNSQILKLPVPPSEPRPLVIVAPQDAREDAPSRAFLERVVASDGPVRAVHYVDVRQSMRNGGGPACLRLRVPLTTGERSALAARVLVDDTLLAELEAWIERHFRDRLVPDDLADPHLARESMDALDALTQLLNLGDVYDFQRTARRTRGNSPA